jgi:hypothetical protein
MKPSSAKDKGRRLQQWTRDKLLSLDPSLEPDDIRSTSMGAPGEDILFSPAARKSFPFSIECKSRTKLAVQDFYEQAKVNCPKGSEPLVVLKQNAKRPLVLVDAEYFFENFGSL